MDKVYSNDLQRTTNTARIVLPRCEFETSPLLREINVGDIGDKPLSVLNVQQRKYDSRDGYSAYGGESKMIKNIIFDFGNVLCEFYPEKLSQHYVEDAEKLKRISEVAFDRLYWDRLDEGTITDEEVRKAIRTRLPGDEGQTGCTVYDNWVQNLTPVKGMEDIVKELKASGKKLYLLSNISVGFAKTYKDVPWIRDILSVFDGLVLSGTIGKTKPGRDIFEYLLKEYSLNGEECIFIDDSPKNIAGGEAVGIKGYFFDGDYLKLKKYLDDLC